MKKTGKVKNFLPAKIISGGQTGVDRSALDAACACAIATGGYMPNGALAEDGKVPEKYNLKETKSAEYGQRTILNIVVSNATLILHSGTIDGGTLLTHEICIKKNKPVLLVNLLKDFRVCQAEIQKFLNKIKPAVLNIAGPRESKSPGIYKKALKVLSKVLCKY
jgi:hypothetical protein